MTHPITQDQVDGFNEGIYFAFENLTTLPAQLHVLSQTTAQVILKEGRYHQIKRMFGHFSNPVLDIHRTQVGHIKLPIDFVPGDYKVVSDPMHF